MATMGNIWTYLVMLKKPTPHAHRKISEKRLELQRLANCFCFCDTTPPQKKGKIKNKKNLETECLVIELSINSVLAIHFFEYYIHTEWNFRNLKSMNNKGESQEYYTE